MCVCFWDGGYLHMDELKNEIIKMVEQINDGAVLRRIYLILIVMLKG